MVICALSSGVLTVESDENGVCGDSVISTAGIVGSRGSADSAESVL